MDQEIRIQYNAKHVVVEAPVVDSLHASMLADRLNSTPYLKVYDRTYQEPGRVTIKAFTISKLFSIDKLQNDMEEMSSLMNLPK